MNAIPKDLRNNKSVLDDFKISWALMASFVILTIQYFILIYFGLIGTSNASKVQLISKLLVGIAFLYSLPAVLRRGMNKLNIAYFVAIFIVVIHYLFFPENRPYINGLLFPLFFMSLPSLLYSMSIKDFNILRRIMGKASLIVFLVGTVLGVLIFAGKVHVDEYSMALSYYMLLPSIIFLDRLLTSFSLKNLLFTLISIIVILALGSRGAILCIVVFFLLKLIKYAFQLSYVRGAYYSIIMGVIILLYINFDNILQSTYNTLLSIGVNSRSIMLFLKGEVHLSGRDSIYDSAIIAIGDKPFIGNGFAGDRRINGGGYVHNIFLEILIDFGIIIGCLVIVGLLCLIIRALFQRDLVRYNMTITWISLGFIPLMISSSYITDMKFWILIGLIIRGVGLSKKQIEHRSIVN
ncbi:O-antigen ligase family protein [Priestia endophytica]|uniref:O-antigen ligase family protein n=1 Tax=Priestia endophytica TaxID=135735 RepID=UPI00203AED61|nr:O-antigen ligase family protein [Priestia endophytica]MCM3539122.1 O-antigen ligase family protein [Priestia endophytica]